LRRDVLLQLVSTPQQANAMHLLRSTTFNPRDLCLPPAYRRAVEAAIAETHSAVQDLAAELAATADREFAGLHVQGLARPVDIGRIEGILQLEKIGSDPVFRVIQGNTFGVSKTRMPETRRIEASLYDAGAALVARLAEVFAAAGAITREEREALAMRAQSAADRRSSGSGRTR
jgi:hypothetical protein